MGLEGIYMYQCTNRHKIYHRWKVEGIYEHTHPRKLKNCTLRGFWVNDVFSFFAKISSQPHQVWWFLRVLCQNPSEKNIMSQFSFCLRFLYFWAFCWAILGFQKIFLSFESVWETNDWFSKKNGLVSFTLRDYIFAKVYFCEAYFFVKCTLLTHLLSFASFFFLSFLLKFFLLMLKAKVDVNVDVKVEREGWCYPQPWERARLCTKSTTTAGQQMHQLVHC